MLCIGVVFLSHVGILAQLHTRHPRRMLGRAVIQGEQMKVWHWIVGALAVLLLLLGVVLFEGDLPAAEVEARYSNSSSQFFELTNGARIHYRDEGLRDGPALLLIHGAMASLHTWGGWVEALGNSYRVISVDLPGHGLTGPTPPFAEGEDPFLSSVAQLLLHLDVSRVALAGNSMGGGVSWRYALEYPQQVSGLILIAAVPPRTPDRAVQQGGGGSIGFRLLRMDWFRAVARYLDPRLLVEQGLRSAYHNSPVVDDALVQRYSDMILREGTRAAILNRAQGRRSSPDVAQLATLSTPTLVMWGAHDALIPVSTVDVFQAALPHAKTVVFPDLGHVPMEEAPQRTARLAAEFLGGLDTSAAVDL